MDQTECSETSTYKIQTPGNYPEENIQHTEHGEILKSRILGISFSLVLSVSSFDSLRYYYPTSPAHVIDFDGSVAGNLGHHIVFVGTPNQIV
jgi:lysyl-tRNA synthetase class I